MGAAATSDSDGGVLGRYRDEVEEPFLENPLANFLYLQQGPEAGFNNLIEAPGHFYKIRKNSYSFPMTCRSSTKFAGQK